MWGQGHVVALGFQMGPCRCWEEGRLRGRKGGWRRPRGYFWKSSQWPGLGGVWGKGPRVLPVDHAGGLGAAGCEWEKSRTTLELSAFG